MKIHIPNSAFLGNIDTFLRSFDPSDPRHLEITAHEKWIAVHPMVLSMVAALGLKLEPKAVRCQKIEAKSAHYLVRMGLFKYLHLEPPMEQVEHEAAGRFIELTQIRNSTQLSDFIANMIPLLHLEITHSRTIGYVVSELVRNVLEHSQSPQGAVVCAQYYKKSNSIRLGIADTGMGIKSSINHSHPASTDLEAIRLALMPGITGTTRREGGTSENAGAGLFFIKSIASVNRSHMLLYSGQAMYKLLKSTASKRLRLHADPFGDRHSTEEKLPVWRGTLVGVDINLERSENFEHLLDAIHSTYTKAVRERRKARYKKPRFV